MFSNSASLRSNSIGHTFWPNEEYVAGTCCTFSTADRAGRHQSESDASCSSGKFFTMVETREEAQEGLGLPAPATSIAHVMKHKGIGLTQVPAFHGGTGEESSANEVGGDLPAIGGMFLAKAHSTLFPRQCFTLRLSSFSNSSQIFIPSFGVLTVGP